MEWAEMFVGSEEPAILCGDLNIAHTEDDIWDPKGNKRSSGFLEHEREWFTRLLNRGWHDLLRIHIGPQKGPYTWWSNFRRARSMMKSAEVMREGGMVVSDHAPVIVDFDI